MIDLSIDFETRSACDLRKSGVHVYAEDPTTSIWCMAHAFDGEPDMWLPGDPVPVDIAMHAAEGGCFVAHNAAFEIEHWSRIMVPKHGFPALRAEQWRCTMAQAYAMSLPGALGDVAGALGLGDTKDMAGHRLMMSMCKPRKVIGILPAVAGPHGPEDAEGWEMYTGADGMPLKIRWWNDIDRKQRLYEYCKQDVRVERAADERLLRLRPQEQKLWVLDQKINGRGIYVDEKACAAAMAIVDTHRAILNKKIKDVSGLEVTTTSAVAQIVDYLATRGITAEGLAKDQVSDMLTWDVPEDVRQVLELRQSGARMSVAKIKALLLGRSKDGRAKGLTQYHAASTGRWGGRRFQPQNLKRPGVDQDTIDFLIELLRTKAQPGKLYEVFAAMTDDPIEALGDCIRGLVGCPPGRVMGAADFANIEGRVLAWLAGEQWKLDAFRDYDAGTGPDLYKLAFSRSFNKPIEQVTSGDRQVGKVEELALGFQGGPGAFQSMAKNYRVDIGAQYDSLLATAEQRVIDESIEAWSSYGSKSKMAERDWIAAEIVKRAWRHAHPATVALWTHMEDAALLAVKSPGAVVNCGRVRFRATGSFLFMQLPSGRCLCYPYPKPATKTTPWGKDKELVTFFGQNTTTRQWGRQSTYGGKLTENATQAVARDLLAEALLRLDDAGVDTVLHVHDEAVFYADPSVENCEHVCSIMSQLPEWAAGLPVAAEGWIGSRYRK